MFLLPRRRELVRVRDHLLERAVLGDQLAGGLVADPGDARDVVGGVALEPDEVRNLVGADPVAELDPLGRVDVHVRDAARRHHQDDVRGAELEGVAVGRDDGRLHARLVRAGGERRDHVVRLPALELEVAVAERLHDRAEVRELLAQQVGHRPASLLVDHVRRLGDRVALGRARVPGDRDPLRPVVGEQLEEHVREAEERIRRKAVARRELLRKGEEGAVGEVVAVDEEELGVPRRPVVELQLLSGEGLRRHSHRVYAAGRRRRLPLGIVARSWRSFRSPRGRSRAPRRCADGGRVAHLVGALGEAPSRGRHAWVGLGDHSLAPGESPELLADVYAAAGARWVEDAYLTHIVEVPAEGPLPQLFFALGFGQEQVHASAPARAEEPSALAGRGDSPGAAGRHRAAPRRRRRDRRAPGRPARLVRACRRRSGRICGTTGSSSWRTRPR